MLKCIFLIFSQFLFFLLYKLGINALHAEVDNVEIFFFQLQTIFF